jgi:hypothetical protein
MVNLEKILEKYGLTMPNSPKKGGIYEPVKEFGPNFATLCACSAKGV